MEPVNHLQQPVIASTGVFQGSDLGRICECFNRSNGSILSLGNRAAQNQKQEGDGRNFDQCSCDEANNILEDLPSELKITKDVITLHMAILLKAGEYLKASYLAETLSMSEPDDVDRLLMVARYRYKAGEFRDSLAWLMYVQKKCSGDAYFHYLCAQCHAALGDQDAAKDSLKKVSAMSEDLKMRAVMTLCLILSSGDQSTSIN